MPTLPLPLLLELGLAVEWLTIVLTGGKDKADGVTGAEAVPG